MKVGQTRQLSRASLEESTQRALAIRQDFKIPDGPIVIDKDLLQEIRDKLCSMSIDHCECDALCSKLDSLYPYLK